MEFVPHEFDGRLGLSDLLPLHAAGLVDDKHDRLGELLILLGDLWSRDQQEVPVFIGMGPIAQQTDPQLLGIDVNEEP